MTTILDKPGNFITDILVFHAVSCWWIGLENNVEVIRVFPTQHKSDISSIK